MENNLCCCTANYSLCYKYCFIFTVAAQQRRWRLVLTFDPKNTKTNHCTYGILSPLFCPAFPSLTVISFRHKNVLNV